MSQAPSPPPCLAEPAGSGAELGHPQGLTLAWYSLMKGWDLWASFSWDR